MAETHFEKPKKRKSVLARNSSYRSNTTSGFVVGPGKNWEAHHVLCNHAVEGRVIEKNKEYVEDCLWITDWDLNNGGNMIGLPTNRQYRQSLGAIPLDLPSHQVDHNTVGGYTEECKEWLKINVWDTLLEKKDNHEIDAKDIKALLEGGTTTFLAKIHLRGSRKGGTKHCWDRRFPAHAEHVDGWYHPFSMAKKPSPRSPGIDWSKLENIFKKLG